MKIIPVNHWAKNEDQVQNRGLFVITLQWCKCGCQEVSMVFAILGFGIFITTGLKEPVDDECS